MAKKGIKVKDLAVELGMTSRDLVDLCRANDIFAQNSLTKLNPECETKLRQLIGQNTEENKSTL